MDQESQESVKVSMADFRLLQELKKNPRSGNHVSASMSSRNLGSNSSFTNVIGNIDDYPDGEVAEDVGGEDEDRFIT